MLNGPNRSIRLLIMLLAALCCAGRAVSIEPDDVPASSPRQTALNPCFSVQSSGIRLPDGSREPATEMICGGDLTWDVPQGASSFHVTLWRAESANSFAKSLPVPTGEDAMRVLISIDGKPAADTILHDSTPAERWTIPVNHARTLSVQMVQEYGAFGLYLGNPGFSSRTVQVATLRHVLSSGQGYVNLGAGPRQSAFCDFHPGETVPIQAEFAGSAARAEVQIHFVQTAGAGARSVPVHLALQSDSAGSVGSAQWVVPSIYGPANVQLNATVNGQQVYSATYQIALAKAPDPSTISDTSNFGIHQSTNGSLFLQDQQVSLWGAKWARFFIDWNIVEAQEGKYDWHWIDGVVDSYSAQHLSLTGVMGHLPPPWITDPGTQMKPAYEKFVNAALEHFKGKITVWGVYNEIDSKFYNNNMGFDRQAQPTGDIQILLQELRQMERSSPPLVKICCAAGGSGFLPYAKRLFDGGVLEMADAVELHVYQAGPPEESDYGLSYVEMVERLEKLAASYGKSKQVWTTESNWLFGPAGTPNVGAPDVTEREQSQYLVRCSLLSLGMHTPYFIHSPFFFSWHRSVLTDSLASYTELTSLLADARNAHLLSLPPHLYGLTATTAAGTVLALWTDSLRLASAHVSGMTNVTIQDMYGNPVPASEDLQLSGSPVYLIGQGSPVVTGAAAPPPAQRALSVATWKVSSGTSTQPIANRQIHVTSSPTTYGTQLKSGVEDVIPKSCYVITPTLVLHRGGVNVEVIDPDANKILRNQYIYTVSGNDQYQPRIRVKTGDSSHLQVVVAGCNPHESAVSDFEIGSVTMGDCP